MFNRKKEKKELKVYTDKYDKIIIIGLIALGIFNLIQMFVIIKEINWVSIGYFSLTFLIIRYFLFKIYYKKYNYLTVLIQFFKTILKNILLGIILISAFTIYQNNINPATLNIITLNNGDKDVVFVQMAHIGGKDYYNKVNKTLKEYGDKDYVLYYEGIELDIPKEDIVSKLGILPTAKTYEGISKLLGDNIQVQDTLSMIKSTKKAKNTDVKFSELLNNKPVNMESSTGTFETKLLDNISRKELEKRDKEIQEKINKGHESKDAEAIERLVTENSVGNSDTLISKGLKYFFKAVFNFSIKHEEGIGNIVTYIMPEKKAFFGEKVLGKRNEKLAYNIINSKDKKIIITYGGKHFEGVLEDLQKKDKKWKIKDKKEIVIFK